MCVSVPTPHIPPSPPPPPPPPPSETFNFLCQYVLTSASFYSFRFRLSLCVFLSLFLSLSVCVGLSPSFSVRVSLCVSLLSLLSLPPSVSVQDLEQYASSYSGLMRIERLHFVAEHCPRLRAEALKMALAALQARKLSDAPR